MLLSSHCTLMNLDCRRITTVLFACMGIMVQQFLYTQCTVPFVPWLVLHHYSIKCMYTLHDMVVSVQPMYSTVCTIVGAVSLPYHMHVLQYTPHGMVWLVPHYHIVCMYTLHCTVVSVHTLYVPFVPCWYHNSTLPRLHRSIAVSHLFVLQQTPHWSLPSSNLLLFLLLSSFFASLSLHQSPSHSWWVFSQLLVCHVGDLVDCTLMNLVTACLAYCWWITTISVYPVYNSVCTMLVRSVSHYHVVYSRYTLHGMVVSVHLLYSIVYITLQSLRCHIFCIFKLLNQTLTLSLSLGMQYILPVVWNTNYTWSRASGSQFFGWVNQTTCQYRYGLCFGWLSGPISIIDTHAYCMLDCCVQLRKVQGFFNSFQHRHNEAFLPCKTIGLKEARLPSGGANEFTSSTHWCKSTFIEDCIWKVFVCSRVSNFRVFIILDWQVVLVINTICWWGNGT